MRETELRQHATCDLCLEPIGRSGVPLFWAVRLVQHGVKLGPVVRQSGLGMQIGAELARVLGPDEDLTEIMNDVTATVCHDCAIADPPFIYRLAQRAGRGLEPQAATPEPSGETA